MSDTEKNTTSTSTDPPNPPNIGIDADIKMKLSTKEFKKIIKDFVIDLLKTYPELEDTLDENLRKIKDETDDDNKAIMTIFDFCCNKYPKRFFDILYQNEKIFHVNKSQESSNNEENDANDDDLNDDDAEFLPNIDFSVLWKENISDNTRSTLWKYLQLILFTIVTSLNSEETFGDTAKLFEAINEDEFKAKLEETMDNMHKLFENCDDNGSEDDSDDQEDGTVNDSPPSKKSFADSLPKPEELHEHVSEMMNGKLGKLAKEIADETAKDLNLDADENHSVKDVFETLFKQPTKLMSLVKKVGNKLDTKMKSGDIKESELLEEASQMMNKMKNMPGMGNLQEMFGKMGMGGKMDLGAMKNNLNKNMRAAKQKERMREKLYERQLRRESAEIKKNLNVPQPKGTLKTHGVKDGIEKMTFSTGDKVERSVKQPAGGNKKKRRKNKK